MSDKIAKLEAKIKEIADRPTYSSTPAWQQEVAELRMQIEVMRSGREVERKEYQRATVAPAVAGAHGGEAVGVVGEDTVADEDAHDDEHHPPYVGIFFTLAVLTLLEWKCAQWFGIHGVTLWVMLAVMAIVKALMVAFYFMHLAFERKTMHALLTVPLILVVVLFVLLVPDARQHVWDYLSFMR